MADPRVPAFGDYVLPFQIERPGIRGRLVRLGATVEAITRAHDYPPAVAAMLAEALAMSAVLASGLKYDGIFTLQIQSDGPLGLIVVDVTSAGDMRGYARFGDRVTTLPAQAQRTLAGLLGHGRMSFTVDQGAGTERYQGVTALEGTTLGECCQAYFRQSEQLATAMRLCASDVSLPGAAARSAALVLQRLPQAGHFGFEDDEDWRRSAILMSSITDTELLAPDLDDARILYRLFHEDGVRIYRQRPLRHRCRCSREKVERTLQSFPRREVKDMVVDGVLTVTCEFCKAIYRFDEQAVDELHDAFCQGAG
jgi:molecular chaperone Hsp33